MVYGYQSMVNCYVFTLADMKRINLTLLFFSFLCIATGQSIKYKIDSTADGSLKFPVFLSGSKKPAVEKINQFLQLSELELIKGKINKNIFKKVSINNGSLYGAKVRISFDVKSNNNKILSIVFDEASSGMTSHYYNKFYNFNAGNGDFITMPDLFTTEGYETFKTYSIAKRKINLQRQEDSLQKADGKPANNNLQDIFGLFKLNDDEFYIERNQLFIDDIGALGKWGLFYGYDMACPFDVSEFSNYLNDYGKALFSFKKNDITAFHSKSIQQLYKGFLGDSVPIALILRPNYMDDYGYLNVDGIYAYTKYGKGIYLHGKTKDDFLMLNEEDETGERKAEIITEFKNYTIEGTWTNVKTNQAYKFYVKRY